MPTDRDDPTKKGSPENADELDLTDHPGLQKINKNPNPRANENISGAEAGSNPGPDAEDRTDEVGSEITDGEGG